MNKNLERLYIWLEQRSNFLLFDLEANTNWEWELSNMETIQIGYILFDYKLEILKKGSIFIKPTINNTLTDFIKSLTWISQKEVDSWVSFQEWFKTFVSLYNPNTDYIMSYWNYDMKQLYSDCANNNMEYPFAEGDRWKYSKHINIKNALAKKLDIREKWMESLLEYLWLELEWKHHNWEDDCGNILKLVKHVFFEK